MSLKTVHSLASAEFLAHFRQPPGTSPVEEDLVHWQQLCRDLIQERNQLREELASAKQEKDQYRKSLLALTQKDIPFTKDQVLAQLEKGRSLHELIAELERPNVK